MPLLNFRLKRYNSLMFLAFAVMPKMRWQENFYLLNPLANSLFFIKIPAEVEAEYRLKNDS